MSIALDYLAAYLEQLERFLRWNVLTGAQRLNDLNGLNHYYRLLLTPFA